MTSSAPNAIGPARATWSLWAIASVACSVLACPPLCLLGPLLGAVGLAQVRRRTTMRGRGLAIAGIAIGLLWTGVWLTAARWWHVHVRTPIIEGPGAALAAGLGGDVATFREAFDSDAPSDAAAAFLDELARRYGTLQAVMPDPTVEAVNPGAIDRQRPVMRYALQFDSTIVAADARFVIWGGAFDPVCRWGSIIVRDAQRGDLAYPVAADESQRDPMSVP